MPKVELTAEEAKAVRASLGWTQEKLAKFAGVSVKTVYNWERRGAKHAAAALLSFVKEKLA